MSPLSREYLHYLPLYLLIAATLLFPSPQSQKRHCTSRKEACIERCERGDARCRERCKQRYRECIRRGD